MELGATGRIDRYDYYQSFFGHTQMCSKIGELTWYIETDCLYVHTW